MHPPPRIASASATATSPTHEFVLPAGRAPTRTRRHAPHRRRANADATQGLARYQNRLPGEPPSERDVTHPIAGQRTPTRHKDLYVTRTRMKISIVNAASRIGDGADVLSVIGDTRFAPRSVSGERASSGFGTNPAAGAAFFASSRAP